MSDFASLNSLSSTPSVVNPLSAPIQAASNRNFGYSPSYQQLAYSETALSDDYELDGSYLEQPVSVEPGNVIQTIGDSSQQIFSSPASVSQVQHSSQDEYDALTGIAPSQAIAGPTEYTSASYNSFSPTYGYGLVNAAAAVAWASGYTAFTYSDLPDLGGVNAGNDMVKAPEVWANGIKGQGVTVAVIDSGVDINHPELANNIWINSDEVAGDNVDNDGNGYTDDVYGWNFAQGQYNNNVLPGNNSSGQDHGTHVAGTIAADDNGFGTTGVAPDAKIMAIKIGDVQMAFDGEGYFSNAGNLAEAIIYAVDNGADVINLSLGWVDSYELQIALAYAASFDVVVVSAAGNESQPSPGTPANYATSFGLSVGAVDYQGSLASFSNQAGRDSRMQHVVAPGVNIYSATPGGGYNYKDGTSMAAPHVAGVVALMLSANSSLTHSQVRDIVTASATDLDDWNDYRGGLIKSTSDSATSSTIV